jgi:hypothetical protein
MKKRFLSIFLVGCMLATTVGCGNTTEPEEKESQKEDSQENQKDDEAENADKDDKGAELDITDKDAVWDFLQGTWSLYDPYQQDTFAIFTIEEDGSCSFIDNNILVEVEGSFAITNHQTYDYDNDELIDDPEYYGFELDIESYPPEYIDALNYIGDGETTSGYFYVGRGDGRDYLYLKWLGNGDSYTFDEVFQNRVRLDAEYDESGQPRHQTDWVFIKTNEGIDAADAVEGETFYGWVWENTEGNLLVQEMDCHSYEDTEEYVPRRYNAAYFTEKSDIGLVSYKLSDNADTSLVFREAKTGAEHPLIMYEITTDSEGDISALRELDRSLYDIYDLGDAAQEYSYEGLEFTVNGMTVDLEQDFDTPANEILDMYPVGGWYVIETHVNPHSGVYYFYNLYTGLVEKNVIGANLTWLGDDITTAVYSYMDTVYNFKGYPIGNTDGEEIYEISFNSAGDEITVKDFSDNSFTFEVDQCDKAMYRYADFLRHGTVENWKAFMDEAPEDSLAFVMENPPEEVANLMGWIDNVDMEGGETLYLVALSDNMRMHLDYGEIDLSTLEFKTTRTIRQEELIKGNARGYFIIIGETMPTYAVYFADNERGAEFRAALISGRYDQRGAFVTANMTAEEAFANSDLDPSNMEFDLADAYMDTLFKYKEAQEGAYSQEQVEEMGLRTELIQHSWPQYSDNSQVKYEFMNIDDSDPYELVITYNGSIIDIYGSDGNQLIYAFGTPYRGEATLYADGLLEELYAPSMDRASTTWFRYDTDMGYFFPAFEMVYEVDGNNAENIHYYTFSYEADRNEIYEHYKENGDLPEYVWEWADEITEEEYNEKCSKAEKVDVSNGLKIADFNGI